MKILYVCTDPEKRTLVRDRLRKENTCTVETAVTPRAALDFISDRTFDLVVSDQTICDPNDGTDLVYDISHFKLGPLAFSVSNNASADMVLNLAVPIIRGFRAKKSELASAAKH